MTLSTPTTEKIAADITRPRGKVSVIFCGGTGCDISLYLRCRLNAVVEADRDALADVSMAIVDTSRSNLTPEHSDMDLYVLKNSTGGEMDGGGKIMNAAFRATKEQGEDIIRALKPAKNVLLVGNMGGGSGGAISSQLARKLLDKGHNVLMLAVASVESKTVQENTRRSMSLYQEVVTATQRSLVVAPFMAGKTNTFEQINEAVADFAFMQCILFSNKNARMDSADLHNWVNFEKALKIEPALIGLYMTVGDTPMPENVTPLTVATLTSTRNEDAAPGWMPAYQAHGILPVQNHTLGIATPTHFVIADGVVSSLYKTIDESVEALKRQATLVAPIARLASNDDMDGMSID